MKINFFYMLFLFFTISILPQSSSQLEIETGKGIVNIPSFQKEGTLYFPIKLFADALNINYYYNSETEKIELKFSKFNLKITANNPFIVTVNRYTYDREVYQIPTSTYLINDEIFIPIIYTLNIIKRASGIEMAYEKPNKLLIKDKSIEPNLAFDEEEKEEPASDIKDFDITGISVDEKANGTLIRIKSKKRIATYNSSYKDGDLKIIFRKTTVDPEKINRTGGTGLVKEIKARNLNGDTEFQFILGPEYSTSEVLNVENGDDILITIHNKVFAKDEEKERNKTRWNFNCIVIDAGHGGKDGGAVGVNGVKEKVVNLGIALKLGELIKENLKDVKVVYTRSNDTFVELYKRGKIANEKEGKLFISIHCNSTAKKPTTANGFEVYLLRPGRTQEAIEIAERENSVIEFEEDPERYQQLTDENFILVSMAHSAYMKYSEKFAEILDKQFSLDLNLASRGVKQAGFYVLVGASMPSVLIETGFLSNKKDADYLKSKNGQNKIAESIFQAIKNFKVHYENIVNSELN